MRHHADHSKSDANQRLSTNLRMAVSKGHGWLHSDTSAAFWYIAERSECSSHQGIMPNCQNKKTYSSVASPMACVTERPSECPATVS